MKRKGNRGTKEPAQKRTHVSNEYTGRRFSFELACCWLSWSLAQLNPDLLKQPGLLQRVTDHVKNLFKGCASRGERKTHRASCRELKTHRGKKYKASGSVYL